MNILPSRAPGFYGKLIHHGDFIGRRLPPSFVTRWDNWLQDCLDHARSQLGPIWMDTYLNSPLWRFLLIEQTGCWSGVCMPSVDSVGRQFPLTLAMAMPPNTDLQSFMSTADEWFVKLESLALSTLRDDYDLASFEAALQSVRLDYPRVNAVPIERVLALDSVSQIQPVLSSLAVDLLHVALVGQSLWWTQGSALLAPVLIRCAGLPRPSLYCGMLNGQLTAAFANSESSD